MENILANSQKENHQKTQDDRYSNLNPKPKPYDSRDPIRNPDPEKRPGENPD